MSFNMVLLAKNFGAARDNADQLTALQAAIEAGGAQ